MELKGGGIVGRKGGEIEENKEKEGKKEGKKSKESCHCK